MDPVTVNYVMTERREEITRYILRELIAGTWRTSQIPILADKHYLSVDTIAEYLRAARAQLALIMDGQLPQLRAEVAAVVAHIRERCLDSDNYTEALAACRDIAKLYGLNAPERRALAVSGADSWPSALRDELQDPENKAPLPQ